MKLNAEQTIGRSLLNNVSSGGNALKGHFNRYNWTRCWRT